MSVTVSTDIFCDGEGCIAWEHGVTGPRAYRREARLVVSSRGWKFTNDEGDLCPDCVRNLMEKKS
jgi:hypothetical protein